MILTKFIWFKWTQVWSFDQKAWGWYGIKHLNDSNAFIECSDTMDDVYENIDEYNPTRKKKSWLCLMAWLQRLWQIKNFKP